MNPRHLVRQLLRRVFWWRSREASYAQGYRDGYADGWDGCVGEALPMLEDTYSAHGDKNVAALRCHPADALANWNKVNSPTGWATDKEKS